MCFITVSSLLPAVFFFSIGAFLFSMPIVIYLPSSSLRPSRPPLGQARSFPGALVNSIYQHPISKWYSLQSDQLDKIWPSYAFRRQHSAAEFRRYIFFGCGFFLWAAAPICSSPNVFKCILLIARARAMCRLQCSHCTVQLATVSWISCDYHNLNYLLASLVAVDNHLVFHSPFAATAVFCGSAYLLVIRRQELSERLLMVGTSLKDYLYNAFGSLVSSTRPITKDPFFGSSAKGTSSEKTMPETASKTVDANSIEGLEGELKGNTVDPNSFAKPDEAKVSHLHLQIGVDFDKHILNGNVILTVNRAAKTACKLLLDTFELSISEVQLLSDDGKSPLQWTLHKAVPEFGSKLEIDLSLASGTSCKVQIDYQTSATARALQWLTPEQTEGGMHPFMFSQCQAINARSMVPCQDTPAVKATYTAEVSVSQVRHLIFPWMTSPDRSPTARKSANERQNKQRTVKVGQQQLSTSSAPL